MITSDKQVLYKTHIDTPLGPMLVIANERCLYLLEFTDRHYLDKTMARFKRHLDFKLVSGKTPITCQIEQELLDYFFGISYIFKTPYYLLGSVFDKTVWRALSKIPVGQTRSYLELAKSIGNANAYRAVANANGRNQLAIIIPCHRVINKNGQLGGYAGGLDRKQWLIDREIMRIKYS